MTESLNSICEPYIFISHAGSDTDAAKDLAEKLRSNGFRVRFDRDNLRSGDEWMPTIEAAISSASGMIVYVGALGIQHWVDREVRFGLVRNTQNPAAFRFIPVLGPGADSEKLPPFVKQHQYVDFRKSGQAAEQMRLLLNVLHDELPWKLEVSAEYWKRNTP